MIAVRAAARNTIRFAGLAQDSDAFIEIMLNPLVKEVAGCARIVETAVAGLGALDILINNAGWGNVTLLGETTEESWDRSVD